MHKYFVERKIEISLSLFGFSLNKNKLKHQAHAVDRKKGSKEV